MTLCKFKRQSKGKGWRCPDCKYVYPYDAAEPPRKTCKAATELASKPKPAPALILNEISETGPCVHRGALIEVVRCELCGQRHKMVETFACMPDAGYAGPPLLASEAKFKPSQTLNLKREVCRNCVRYEAAESSVLPESLIPQEIP